MDPKHVADVVDDEGVRLCVELVAADACVLVGRWALIGASRISTEARFDSSRSCAECSELDRAAATVSGPMVWPWGPTAPTPAGRRQALYRHTLEGEDPGVSRSAKAALVADA